MKNPGFRFDPQRSVFICGEINAKLVERLTEQILKFRYESRDPVSLIIDSPGGSTRQTAVLKGLLTAPDQDGNEGRVIALVTGQAASAAADILVCSDYAIAYPAAILHFHGARYEAVGDLTVESSKSLGNRLSVSNRRTAIREARRALNRIVLRYIEAQKEFETIRAAEPDETLDDLDCFAQFLRERAQSSALPRIIDRTQETRKHINEKLVYVSERLEELEPGAKASDIQIYRILLDYAEKEDPEGVKHLSEELRANIDQGFALLSDYLFGEHTNDRLPIIRRFGRFFLSSEDAEKFKLENFQRDEDRDKWLSERVEQQVEGLWYFTILLWRNLQNDENPLTPCDGFWVGAVDEVLGSELTSLRQIVEAASEDTKDSENDQPRTDS